jgi:ABC-type branched-subunit amino acid transport system substrate-binding protein
VARRAGAGEGALPDAAVEPTPVSNARKVNAMRRSPTLIAAVVATGLSLGTGLRAEAQPPLRIGASLSQTGSFAVQGQDQLRGYQLCVKHANEKGDVLGRRIELYVEKSRYQSFSQVIKQ